MAGYTVSTYSYVGSGQFFLGLRPGGGLRQIGNVSKCEFTIDEETVEELDYMHGGGGVRNSQSRIKKASGSLDVYDYSPENLALALRGSISAVTAAAVNDESHEGITLGCLVPFTFLPDPDEAVTVKLGETTVNATGNYTRTSSGILIASDAADLDDDDDITISYKKYPSYVLEALTASGQEYRLYFQGLNDFDTGEPVLLDIFRVKFSPAKNLGVVGDKQLSLALEFTILLDSTITAQGKSQYFKATLC